MGAYIRIETQRVPGRNTDGEMKIWTLLIEDCAIDGNDLNPGSAGYRKGGPDLDHIPPIPVCRHRPYLHVHGARLIRLVLLHPEHHYTAYHYGAAVGDYADNHPRHGSPGRNSEKASLAGESTGQRDQQNPAHHRPAAVVTQADAFSTTE